MKGDMFGRPLAPGDLVVAVPSYSRRMELCQVHHCSKRLVFIQTLDSLGNLHAWKRRCRDAVFVLKAADATKENIEILIKKREACA